MVSQKYQVGDKVEYAQIGENASDVASTTTGEIVEIATSNTEAGKPGMTAHATEEEPRYKIKNDNTGKVTAYKEQNILKKL